jgi:hypothetical protein
MQTFMSTCRIEELATILLGLVECGAFALATLCISLFFRSLSAILSVRLSFSLSLSLSLSLALFVSSLSLLLSLRLFSLSLTHCNFAAPFR